MMDKFKKVKSRIRISMGMEELFGMMVTTMRVLSRTIRNMVLENWSSRMVRSKKVYGNMVCLEEWKKDLIIVKINILDEKIRKRLAIIFMEI